MSYSTLPPGVALCPREYLRFFSLRIDAFITAAKYNPTSRFGMSLSFMPIKLGVCIDSYGILKISLSFSRRTIVNDGQHVPMVNEISRPSVIHNAVIVEHAVNQRQRELICHRLAGIVLFTSARQRHLHYPHLRHVQRPAALYGLLVTPAA